MKKVIGLVLLLIVLVAVSGCTQQAKTATTTATTVAPTTIATPVETTVEETPVEVTTEVPVEATAASANETAAVETENVTPAATVAAVTASMTPSTKVTVIHIANNTFTPATLMILPGTGITWVNDDSTVHSVRMVGEHAGKFNSGDIVPGGRWGYSFGDAEGTFQYADGYNLNVTGVIIVKKGDSLVGNIPVTKYVTSNQSW
jgi:plastocyanin